MNKSEELIACLEGEIAKRDARIVELESGQSADMFLTLTGEITQLRAELSAIKAQGVVMPKSAIMVGRSELALVRNALALDCEQGRPVRGEMLAALDASIERFDRLNAAHAQQVSVPVSGVPSIKCWSCHSVVSLDDRADADGSCPHCCVELDLEEYLRAMLAAAPAAPAAPAADAGLVEALEKIAALAARRSTGVA